MNDCDTTRSRGNNHGTLRSAAAMKGLLLAEVGDGMVQFNVGCEGSGFMDGSRIIDDTITPGGGLGLGSTKALAQVGNLARHDTLITENASPERIAVELQRLLGNSNAKLKAGGTLLPPQGGTSFEEVSMEQAKPRARVEVDIILENNIFVQGADVRGHIVLNVRKPTKKEGPVLLYGGKVRVVGYESIPGTKKTHPFYHCSAPISIGSPYFHGCYVNEDKMEEYLETLEGTYQFPLCMRLPLSDEKGCPKGVMPDSSGPAVRYITVVSLKVKDDETGKQSVAHFYRSCEVWPRLDMTKFLSPAPRPLRATTSKSLFMGGEGKLILTAGLVRLYWVSGQQCFVQIGIQNETKKMVTCVTLALLRNTVVFRPQPQLDTLPVYGDPDACQTSTTTKMVAESILEAGDKATRGHASAKGWWTGVPPKSSMNFCHSIIIPTKEVSIPRSRLLEVEYILKVTLSAGTLLTTDVQVSLPIRLINFISLDPHISSVLDATLKDPILSRESSSNSHGSRLPVLERDQSREQALNESKTWPYERDVSVFGDSSRIGTMMLENDETSEYLGSLLLDDLSTIDEGLNRVDASARLDQVYEERAPRFADLYYACAMDSQEPLHQMAKTQERPLVECHVGYRSRSISAAAPTEIEGEEDAGTVRTRVRDAEKHIQEDYGDKVPGPAAMSFATRVEVKLRAAGKSGSRPTSVASGVEDLNSRLFSIDGGLSSMPTTSKAEDKQTDRDMATASRASSEHAMTGQREIHGKSGLVKSKIQELEQRFGAASK